MSTRQRVQDLDEIAHQTRHDGRIVRERFYYDTGAAAA